MKLLLEKNWHLKASIDILRWDILKLGMVQYLLTAVAWAEYWLGLVGTGLIAFVIMTCCDGLISDSEVSTEYRTGLHSCFPQYFSFSKERNLAFLYHKLERIQKWSTLKYPGKTSLMIRVFLYSLTKKYPIMNF